MSSSRTDTTVRCSRCGSAYTFPVYRYIDAEAEPALKTRAMSGEFFVRECPSCGNRELITDPVVYRDTHLLLCLSDRDLAVEGLDGAAGRRVADVGSFIEKIKIFDAGLDDVPMELCKFVVRQETGKDAELKFLRTDGADNDIIFTYPENGAMQMLAVGFNVYEDCRAIVNRNPAMTESLKGLSLVDRTWVEQFLR